MNHNPEDIKELTITQLLNGEDKYVIPIYQRNYAWEENEIEQLLQDVIDYMPRSGAAKKNYYIGTLIINKSTINNKILLETIDGQQRITTLSILACIIKFKLNNTDSPLTWFKEINLEFYSRIQSTATLEAIYNNYFQKNYDYNDGLINGYDLVHKHLDKKLDDAKISLLDFSNYLFSCVKILRVQVPVDTDLNHYFEIMNTRGEQLEKHEVLKASLLSIYNEIDDEEEKSIRFSIFNLVWEAVSDMDYYMQYRFHIDIRKTVFGKEWNTLSVKNYDQLYDLLAEQVSTLENKKLDIDKILTGGEKFSKDVNQKNESDKFNSIINFPNFLLHVLRIQLEDSRVVLEDKKLLVTFEEMIKKSPNKIEFVDEFIFNLFKMRFLLDKFVIKRKMINGEEEWSLQTLKHYKDAQANFVNTFGVDSDWENEYIQMLLAMFHVSTPTMIYKNWLNGVLYFLNKQFSQDTIISSENYKHYLETFAKNLLLHRFLSPEPVDYFDLIYNIDKLGLINREVRYDEPKLTYGSIDNNLVFNLLDYILWRDDYIDDTQDFHFSFRSSVEHFYPQNPIGGEPLDSAKGLHSFGNLCLISHSKNSTLRNHLPSAKKDFYEKTQVKDSIKQFVMMYNYNVNDWNHESIADHNIKMVDVFNDFIKKLEHE